MAEKKSETVVKTMVKVSETFVPRSEKDKFMRYHSGVSELDLEKLGQEFGVNDSRGLEHAERAKHVFGIKGDEFRRVYEKLKNSGFGPSDKNSIGDKTIFLITSDLHKRFKNPAFGLLLASRKDDVKSSSESDINRILSLESELGTESPLNKSPLNAYYTENREFVLSAIKGWEAVGNTETTMKVLASSIRTGIPFKVLHESVRDLEGLDDKREFLKTVEILMNRLVEKKGAEAAARITLKKIRAFNKVKKNPVSKDVFEVSMRTGVNFNDLLKEILRTDDDENIRKSLANDFERFSNRVALVFGSDFAEKLNAKSTFEIGGALMKKGLSLDRMLGFNKKLENNDVKRRVLAIKKLFLATRANRSLLEEFKVKPLGFIPDKTFADIYNLSRRYGVDFKKLVYSYGKGGVKRNLSIVLNEARGAKPLGLTYSNLMDRLDKLGVKTVEGKTVGLIAFNRGIPPERYVVIKRDAEKAGIHPFALVDLLGKKKQG